MVCLIDGEENKTHRQAFLVRRRVKERASLSNRSVCRIMRSVCEEPASCAGRALAFACLSPRCADRRAHLRRTYSDMHTDIHTRTRADRLIVISGHQAKRTLSNVALPGV
jgi:hypothetical protein